MLNVVSDKLFTKLVDISNESKNIFQVTWNLRHTAMTEINLEWGQFII